ncbi:MULTISPECIES: hypothetical protein [Clostridium]|uniref:Uncharacterized protein n=1 Tax=Clostridium cibarium TaxID=2762247 RepID=A0ABR8PW41_9CLOT|nr:MULTISPECIES: hypothetical protein [Clostridium]MBD7912359.1 hypothetical protein [Clostridium cibarium]
MKQTLLSKMAIVSIFTFSFLSLRVSAYEMKLNTKEHGSEAREVKVNFNIPDTYTFTIPESIDIDYPSLEGGVCIKVDNSHLQKNYGISVKVKGKNDEFKFISNEGNSIPYKLIDEGNKEVTSGAIAANFTNEKESPKERNFKIKVDEKDILYAGNYKDSMVFDIAVNKLS